MVNFDWIKFLLKFPFLEINLKKKMELFLKENNFDKYLEGFKKNEINSFEIMKELDDDDLISIGMEEVYFKFFFNFTDSSKN